MRRIDLVIVVIVLCCADSMSAGDGFEAVRCESDIPKALIGRTGSDEPVVKIEERHKDIGLKDLGAEIISDDESLNMIFWQICGDEYVVLEDGDMVKDALKFPKHSKETPQFDGMCELNGKELPDVVVGVLKNEEGAERLQAITAWKIDQKLKKFVPLPTEGLRCGRDGISSEDDGR
jgi:hypothetical protein